MEPAGARRLVLDGPRRSSIMVDMVLVLNGYETRVRHGVVRLGPIGTNTATMGEQVAE
jgi:hypothetical protein